MLTEGQGGPIFLCGHGNSGSTLLLALLDSHPELLVFPEETRFFQRILGCPDRRNLEYALEHTGVKSLRQGRLNDRQGQRDYSTLDYAAYADHARRRWAESDGSERALLESLVCAYGDMTAQTARQYWVEKTPGNEMFLKQAVVYWPNLRAIYIIRDPRSVYASIRKSREATGVPLPPEEFLVYWRDSVLAWRRFSTRNPNGLLIRYDDLVQDARGIMQRICAFLGIQWDDVLLQPSRGGVSWSGNSMFGAAFTGISTAPLERYRTALTPAEIHTIEVWLGHLMAQFGWRSEYERPSLSARAREFLIGGSHNPKTKLKMILSIWRAHQRNRREQAA